jgi:hypothetical protein
VRFDHLLPGNAAFHINADWLAAVGFDPFRANLAVPNANDAMLDVVVPSPRAVVADKCGRESLDWGEGMLRIVTSSSLPSLRVAWRQAYRSMSGSDSVIVQGSAEQQVRDGAAEVCGVPRGAVLQVWRAADSTAAVTATMPADRLAQVIRLP